MRYYSIFSGIEAASVAWGPLKWTPLLFSEIDEFPSAVLKERFPNVPNLGDITKINWKEAVRDFGRPDIVVGGSPCQAFSIAGLREGLKDTRGNLMLEWLRAVDEVKPEFALWENVPGVLSDKTGAFRTLLDSLQSLGYIIDMDILDAQYFGVAQRRKRVFVLGWRVETLLKKKTSASRTITAQILGKILLDTLEGLSAESEKGHASSDCAGSSRDGLVKRMRSFGLRTEEDLLTWLKSLEGEVSARVKKLGYSSWYEIKGYSRYGGYECIRKDGRREVVHRAVMENHIGRKLQKGECVHHIDLDKSNNSIENLHLFNSRSDHRKAHVSLEEVGSRLLQRGVIYFDASEGVYKLCDTGE